MQALDHKRKIAPQQDSGSLLKKILTKKELAHIKFNYSRKGIVSFRVDSSSWLYHFHLKKELLLRELRKQDSSVVNIRFCIGEVK